MLLKKLSKNFQNNHNTQNNLYLQNHNNTFKEMTSGVFMTRKYKLKELQEYLGEHDCGLFGRFKLGSLTTGGAWQNHPRIVEGEESQLEEIAKTTVKFCEFLKEISNTIEKYKINKTDVDSFTLKFYPDTDAFGKYKVGSSSRLNISLLDSNLFLIYTDFFYLYDDKSKGKIRFNFCELLNCTK